MHKNIAVVKNNIKKDFTPSMLTRRKTLKMWLKNTTKATKVSLTKVQFAVINHPMCGPLLTLWKSVQYKTFCPPLL